MEIYERFLKAANTIQKRERRKENKRIRAGKAAVNITDCHRNFLTLSQTSNQRRALK